MNCPRCDCSLKRHTPIAGEGIPYPESGDATICLKCGALLVFDGLAIREANPRETERAMASHGDTIALARAYIAGRSP